MLKFRLLLVALLLGPLVWLLAPVLLGDSAFAFRDAAHYYYPLYHATSSAWSAGQIPLWNPLDNLGTPLAADATAAVFYPGQLILALPIGYPAAYKLYIVLHLLLAAGSSWALARRWQASPAAAALAGMSYMLSGVVLFQHCNVVFLVGAAWLPAALLCADRMLVERSARWALGLGAVLAMMTLGGEPQAGYHAGLIAALEALLLWRNDRRLRRPMIQQQLATAQQRGLITPADEDAVAIARPRWRAAGLLAIARHRFALLALAAVSGLLLSAVQVLPSLDWSRQSERAAYDQPRSLLELVAAVPTASEPIRADGLLVRGGEGSHLNHIYQFSVGPWHAAELCWPNFSGRQFPEHRRWINALPAEGRMWVPSLYLGLLPALLALAVWRVRGRAIPVRLMSWTLLWFGLGSCGWYGLGWLLDELLLATAGIAPGGSPVGPPVGGIYWLMTVTLPGYVYFRYPAKLLVPATLALCMLAAAGWDRMTVGHYRRVRTLLVVVQVMSATGLFVLAFSGVSWQYWLRHIPADALFGPFQATAARHDLAFAFAHTAVLAVVCWLLIPRVATEQTGAGKLRWSLLLLAVTAVDLAVAQRPLLPTTPQAMLDQHSGIVTLHEADSDFNSDSATAPPGRLYRAGGHNLLPREWAETSSPDRLQEAVGWDRRTLLPRYQLLEGRAVINSSTSISDADYDLLLDLARAYGPRVADAPPLPHRSVLNLLGASQLLLDRESPYGDLSPAVGALELPDSIRVYENPQAQSHAWTVRNIVSLPKLNGSSRSQREQRLREIYFPSHRPRDWRSTAVVEENQPPTGKAVPAQELPAREACRIVRYLPQQVEIDVALREPALLVLSDLYTPDWQVEVSTAGAADWHAPVLRANGVMRGVRLPAGEHRVTFHYRPASLLLGARLSLLAWLVAIVGLVLPAMRIAWRGGKGKPE